MRSHRRTLVILIGFVVASFAGGAPVHATIDNFKSYKAAYPGKDAKAYSCKVCHEHPMGQKGDLNAYGKALQRFKAPGDAKKLTEEDFKALDADSDGDGVSTLDELMGGTDPADPASMPEADPAEETTAGEEQTPAKPAAGAESQTGSGASTGTKGGTR